MAIENGVRYDWKKGDVIRHKLSGHPYLVVHIYTAIGTVIVDLEDRSPLRPTLTLLVAEYGNYTSDRNMEIKTMNDNITWEYNPIPQTL